MRAVGYIVSFLVCVTANAATYYVSTTGTNGATGTIDDPLGLSNALTAAVSPATAGDTIWVRGGTYTGAFACDFEAPSNNPIIIRNYNRERVTLDATTNPWPNIHLSKTGVWVWGLELMSSCTNRYNTNYAYGGISFNTSVDGGNHKCINCIIHDCYEGPYVSAISTNTEITGCVIFNAGWHDENGGHGHMLYIQGRDYSNPPKPCYDNIGINSFGTGINTRSGGTECNILMQGNVCANPGAPAGVVTYCVFAGGVPHMDQLSFIQNYTYYSTKNLAANYFFYYAGVNGGTISLVSNVFARGYLGVIDWTNVTYNANTAWDYTYYATNINLTSDSNVMYGMSVGTEYFAGTNGTRYNLSNWRALTGQDMNSTGTTNYPTNNWIYVRPNPYESNRAHIIIYNWLTNDNVSVDISAVFSTGARYEIRNSANYYGPLVTDGIYSGGMISIPMTNMTVAIPTGMATAPTNTAPEFAALILTDTPNRVANVSTLRVGKIIRP